MALAARNVSEHEITIWYLTFLLLTCTNSNFSEQNYFIAICNERHQNAIITTVCVVVLFSSVNVLALLSIPKILAFKCQVRYLRSVLNYLIYIQSPGFVNSKIVNKKVKNHHFDNSCHQLSMRKVKIMSLNFLV